MGEADRRVTCFIYDKKDGERLDRYLSNAASQGTLRHADEAQRTEGASQQSRSFLQKLIREGNITVNGTAQKAGYRLKQNDEVRIVIPEAAETAILPENIPLDILYEDDDLLVVNKPKGMVVHPAAGHSSGTLVNAVLYHCRDSLSGINGMIRPGIVHRIDMDTTGALIVCKNDNAHIRIAEQIKEHSVTRRYLGIVKGIVKQDTGTIETTIGRHPVERKKMAVNVANGRRAVTHYQVLQRFSKHTYMEFKLETGRTHQIRVHMAGMGHPLLGDGLYGKGKNPWHLQGQTLHAAVIGFIHPTTGAYLEVTAPLPEYFRQLLEKNPL